MDNLELFLYQSVKLEEAYGKCISSSCSEELVCFISDTNYIYLYEYANLNRPIIRKIFDKDLKQIHYLSVHEMIFLATDYELILCDRHSFQYNVCYVSEKKIVTFAWNPAETAVVVIDEDNKVFLCNFSTPVFESKFHNDLNAAVPNSLYVGWGSKNTQFHGPRNRQQKEKEKVPLIAVEYSEPKISWRGNGQLFVINFYRNGQRFIKVFDNQLNPLNISSEYLNLSDCVAFMVTGQCIACSSVSEVNTIIIFEKNCKVKSTFEIPENKGSIIKIQYHPEINMLTIYSLDEKKCSYINIYLNTNGIWFLKQQLCFPSCRIVEDFQWINLHEPSYTICRLVVLTNQSIEYYIFRFIINRCQDTSTVAVINGRNILWYNFTEKITPPPISYKILTHSCAINRIFFHPEKPLCIVLDSLFQILIVNLKTFVKLLIVKHIDLRNDPSFHNINWNGNKIEIIFEASNEEIFDIQEHDNFILEVKTIKRFCEKFVSSSDTKSEEPCQNFDVKSTLIYFTNKLKLQNYGSELNMTLNINRELYLDDYKICSGVTSFLVFQDYLLITTVTCKLYCIRLLQVCNILVHSNLNLEETYSREIEQGSKIVTVNNSYPPLITLILPRGNIETIRCHLITIDIVEKLLNENKWKAALDIIRIEKMNWNLLIDLNPERFSEHIQDFIEAAEFGTNLSTIVNDFTNNYVANKYCFAPKECDKTGIVKKIINYLTETDLINNLLSIVAIQQRHFSLKSALNYIKVVFELNSNSNEFICKKALQFLNVKGYFKEIIEAAYSLYSLDFLAFVYRNSTEDPRTYDPEIAALKNLKPIELRFKMCLKTSNVKEGVKYLLRCDSYNGAFVEAYILKHNLEDIAYKCLPPFNVHFEMVSTLYAKHLSKKHKHDQAALVLKHANLILKALEEYKKALDWREVLRIMILLNYSQDEQREVLHDLSQRLSEANRVDEAVLLLNKYNNDYRNAIKLFVEHKAFRNAICLSIESNASEMIEELIIPMLKLHMLELKDKIDEFEASFKKHFNRLQSIRKEKKAKLDSMAQESYEGNDDLYSEIHSMISSSGSSRSRSSQLSSKNKRKEAKKKIDLREGGYYEDIALIRSLHILYSSVFSLGKEVREICFILDHNDLQLAKLLHVNLNNLQDTMKNHITLIWPDVFLNTPLVVDNEILAIVENKSDLDPAYCVPPGEDILSDEWKLEIFV